MGVIAERLYDSSTADVVSSGPWEVMRDRTDDTWQRVQSLWNEVEYGSEDRSDIQVYELFPEPQYPLEDKSEWMSAYIQEHELENVLNRTGDILRSIFGAAAYLEQAVRIDPETGKREFTVIANYEFEGDLNDLFSLHDRFMKEFINEIVAEDRVHFVLASNC